MCCTTFPTSVELTDIDYCTKAISNMRGITLASLNIRSLSRHIDSVQIMLERSDLDLLAINETYLNQSILDTELNIHRYNFITYDRT